VLLAVLGAESPSGEDEDHRIIALDLRKPALSPGLVRELVIGKSSPGLNVRSHEEVYRSGFTAYSGTSWSTNANLGGCQIG
jgi:hypothetical protein